MAGVAATMAAFTLIRHYNLCSAFDLALTESLLWNFREGHGFWISLICDGSVPYPHHFFAEHFVPILYLLVWLDGLSPGPEIILLLQALALAGAAWPAARLARAITSSEQTGLLFGWLWLLQPTLWPAVLYDFHLDAFEPLFFFAFAAAFLKGQRSYLLWAALYLSCKEDTPLYFAATVLLLGWDTGRKTEGSVVAALALLYGLVVWLVIIPSFSPTGQPLHAGRLLTPWAMGGFLPWFTTVLCSGIRWTPFLHILWTLGGLPVLAGIRALPALLALGVMWISANKYQSQLTLHYPLTLLPLLFLAAMLGARTLCALHDRLGARARKTLVSSLAILLLSGLVAGWNFIPGLLSELGYGHPAKLRESRQLLRSIPPDETVTSAITLAPHLARRAHLALLMQPADNTTWLATRLDGKTHPFLSDEHRYWLTSTLLATNSNYGLVAENGLVALLKRGAATNHNAVLATRFAQTFLAYDCHHQTGRLIPDAEATTGRAWYCHEKDRGGALVFGHHLALPAGVYDFTFRVRGRNRKPEAYALLDVIEDRGQTRAAHELTGDTGGYRDLTLRARLTGAGDAEFRVFKIRRGEIAVDCVSWRRVE
jgi:uncharacterized membrane protein